MSRFHLPAAGTSGFPTAMACAALALAASSGGAFAQSAPATEMCLAKTDNTGGRMRFVVLDVDASRFESVGFQQFACPTLTPLIAQGQKDRCDRLRAAPVDAQDMIAALYGLTVSDMCDATDAWYLSTQQAGQ